MTSVTTYVYAGFRYLITRTDPTSDKQTVREFTIRAEDGQHPAAKKDKHLRNALDMYVSELGLKHGV